MTYDTGRCPHCGGESNGVIYYSCPGKTACKDCGRLWEFGEGPKMLTEEEGRLVRPGLYPPRDPIDEMLRPFVTTEVAQQVRDLRAAGHSYRSVSAEIKALYPRSSVISDHSDYGQALCRLAGIPEGE